jgi:UDP-N-acetyl-D-glucosamine dehydrogenase
LREIGKNHPKTVTIPTMVFQNSKTLAIVGQGYVGLPLAMAAVDSGWRVIGIDNSQERVSQINAGSSPVEDVPNSRLVAALAAEKYRITTDYAQVSEASVITICVPTPLDHDRKPDLGLLRSAASSIGPFVSSNTLIVNESTSYPGTLREIIVPTVQNLKSDQATIIHYASSPERVNPGDLIWHQKNTPRLVGAIDDASKERAIAFYRSICDNPVSVSSPEVAEAAKLLENTFRLVNIALINEFAQLCFSNEINVNEVIDAASTKPYGYMPFRPGVGVGGHCIPVDPLYLTWWARENGNTADLVEFADRINTSMPMYVAQRALQLLDLRIQNPRVLIIGVAYKPGVKDVRESPVSQLRKHLLEFGASVVWHDPLVTDWEGSKSSALNSECDVAIFATAQPGLDLSVLIERRVKILDCTNTLAVSPEISSL